MSEAQTVDLLIVGGGINGAGIGRDAAGRGLRVCLVEQSDLASATSSASTKLIHGGLRYLEHFELRLVREALAERERLMGIAPHIVRPLRFILPHAAALRPRWQVRLGLLLYDHLGGPQSLPASRSIVLASEPSNPLRPAFVHGFSYADCLVDDSRLVVLNVVDAAARGARILTRTQCLRALARPNGWQVQCLDLLSGKPLEIQARALVNTAGCSVELVRETAGLPRGQPVRLVQGSHIVVKQLFEGTQAYLLQNQDGRVVFAIPFEGDFTLIGTTDVPFQGDLKAVHIAPWEVDYLCEAVNRYFTRTVSPADVVWTYSGVRALQQAETSNLSEITRDYELRLETGEYGLPALTVIGGKITTYRKLAEAALKLLHPVVGGSARPWTASAALPGGDLPSGDLSDYLESCRRRWPAIPPAVLARLVRSYGTELERFLAGVSSLEALGEHFGAGLTAAEVEHLRTREWAQTTDDILWRRSKLGLHLPAEGVARLERYLRGTSSR